LGDPDLIEPEAFPHTWSERLKQRFTFSYPRYLLQRDIDAAWGELEASGKPIPDEIVAHGLPVDFGDSVTLQSFGLSNVLGMVVLWSITPSGSVTPGSGPLVDFTSHASKYLRACNEADFVNTWIETAQSIVQHVDEGELSVDPEAYEVRLVARAQ